MTCQKLKIKIKEAIVLLIILLLPFSVSAAELNDVVNNLQQRYEKIKDYQADFSQEAVLKLGQTTEKAFGKIYVKKPDMMRWDYDKPRRQQIIINKSEIIIYVPDEKQVMKDRVPQGSVNMTSFITNIARIREDFNIAFYQNKKEPNSGRYFLELTPKKEGMNIAKAVLDVSENDFLILKLSITDLQGNITNVSFLNIRIDAGIKDSLFAFKIPKGVEVIERPKAQK